MGKLFQILAIARIVIDVIFQVKAKSDQEKEEQSPYRPSE